MAATDIPFASRIENTQLKLMAWPKNNVPPQAFIEEDIKKDPNAIVGKVAQRDFISGEIFLKPQLKDRPAGSTLSALIGEGKRAISVRVDDVAGVAGFILPGNKAVSLLVVQAARLSASPRRPVTELCPSLQAVQTKPTPCCPTLKFWLLTRPPPRPRTNQP